MSTPTLAPIEQYKDTPLRKQNTLRNIGLILIREYKNQIFKHSFIVISIIYLLAIIVGSFVPTLLQLLQSRGVEQTQMIVINEAGSIAGMSETELLNSLGKLLNQQGGQSAGEPQFAVMLAPAANLAQEQAKVKNGQSGILLVISRTATQQIAFTYYTTSSAPGDSNAAQVQGMAGQLSVLDRAAQEHLSADQVTALFAQPPFTTANLQSNSRSVADWVTGLILSYLGIILIFISNLLYGAGVAQGVAEEKGSRIMEVLLLAATPLQLMAGKIVGIGLAGLTQLLALVLTVIIMLHIQAPIQIALFGSTSILNVQVTGASITMVLLVLLYFVLGFTLYSTLYAAAGALVDRQEDAQSVSAPISFLFTIGYITSVSLVAVPGVPEAPWFRYMSYVPFWSPTMMLARIGTGNVVWWEIVLTVGLMLLTIPLCAWISARIYRAGVLMYGQRFKSRQLMTIIRTR